MMMMTLEETSLCIDKPMSVGEPDQVTGEMGSLARQIEEMHLQLYEMDINDTTHKQHNIFVQKYINVWITQFDNLIGRITIQMEIMLPLILQITSW